MPTTPSPESSLPSCSACGAEDLDNGFLEDRGEGSQGYLRWIPGPLERGLLGGARVWGKQRVPVHAWRCRRCGHLDLFAQPDA